jgi:NADH:ubiquinone oxidoreductase subunit F (NADH-binding)
MTNFLLPDEPITSLDDYIERGGGAVGLQRAVDIGPAATIEEIRLSGLRGRGGAGFPTGRKWETVARQTTGRRFVVCNGAEGEPGTFKDRTLMRRNPYQLVEGLFIAAFAIGASEAYIACKSSFEAEIELLSRAARELQAAGICRDCPLYIVGGPEEYLFGEEKALLEVIEGRPPLPRLLPPYEVGLYASVPDSGWEAGARRGSVDDSNPTLVNNVETLSNVPHILAGGAEWFRLMGTPSSPGTQVCTVVGDVVSPGVAEVELGTPLAEVIQVVGGGVAEGRTIKAVLSGASNRVVTAGQLDVPLSYEGLQAIGSGMGAGGFIVYDDTACMVEVARLFSRFLYVESCGQCPACKLGSGEITDRLTKLEGGTADDSDIGAIDGWLQRVTDGNRCYLPVQERQVVGSILNAFNDEVSEHVLQGSCPRPRVLPLPKLVDLADGRVRYDETAYRKQPDWTYVDEPGRTSRG